MSALDGILERLIESAIKTPGQPVATKLKGGMIMQVIASELAIKLTLRRPTDYPSDVEWRVVLQHLPWPVVIKAPDRGPNYSLSAQYPIHPKFLSQGKLL